MILRHAFLVFAVTMLPTARILAGEPQTPRTADPKDKCCVLEPMIPGKPHLEGAAAAGWVARHVEGNPQSKIRVVIYEDLQCRDCAVLRELSASLHTGAGRPNSGRNMPPEVAVPRCGRSASGGRSRIC